MSDELKIVLEDVKEKFDTVIEAVHMVREDLGRFRDENRQGHEELRKDTLGLQADMVTAKADIKDLKSDMVIVKKDVKDLKSDMVTVKKDIQDLKTETSSIRQDLHDHRSNTELHNVKGREKTG
jgi:chromosome segregation ATPase